MPLFLLTFVEGLLGPSFAKFAKPLIYFAAALLLCLSVWGWFKLHDHGVIAAHDAKQTAATAIADKKADDHAADRRVIDVTREQTESTHIQEAIDAAKRNGADPRTAYYDCVRKQQSARSAGKPSPVC